MIKSLTIAVFIGLIAGLIDLIPLVLVKAPLINMVSILLFWIITSYFVSTVTIFRNSLAIILGPLVGYLNGHFKRSTV